VIIKECASSFVGCSYLKRRSAGSQVNGRAVTKIAIIFIALTNDSILCHVSPEAPDVAIIKHCARELAEGELCGLAARAEIQRQEVVAHCVGIITDQRLVITRSSKPQASPAPPSFIVQEDAVEMVVGDGLDGLTASRQSHVGAIVAHLARPITSLVGIRISSRVLMSESATVVHSPTLYISVVEDCACGVIARAQFDSCATGSKIHIGPVISETIDDALISAIGIVSPAFHVPIIEYRAPTGSCGGHFNSGAPCTKIIRCHIYRIPRTETLQYTSLDHADQSIDVHLELSFAHRGTSKVNHESTDLLWPRKMAAEAVEWV